MLERITRAIANAIDWYVEVKESMRLRLPTLEDLHDFEEWNGRFTSSTKWPTRFDAQLTMPASTYVALVDELGPETPEGMTREAWFRSKGLYELADVARDGGPWPRGSLPLILLEVARLARTLDDCPGCAVPYEACCCPTHQRGDD